MNTEKTRVNKSTWEPSWKVDRWYQTTIKASSLCPTFITDRRLYDSSRVSWGSSRGALG